MARKILIVEDDEDFAMLIQHALKTAGYETLLAKDEEQALTLAKQSQPGLIISDCALPAGGAWFLQRLRMTDQTRETPVLVLSSVARDLLPCALTQDPETHYLAKPYKKDALLGLIADILSGKPARGPVFPGTILIVEDDYDISAFLKHTLEADGHTVLQAHDGPDAMRKLGLAEPAPDGGVLRPDLIILDIILPVVDGYTIGTQLKENDRTRSIPILVMTAKRGMKELFVGAPNVVAVLDKPLDVKLVKRHVAELLSKRCR